MRKDWSNYGIIVMLPLLAVALVYTTEALARGAFFQCKFNVCQEEKSIPATIWDVLKVDSGGNAQASPAPEKIVNEKLANEVHARKLLALQSSGRLAWYFISEIYLLVCLAALAIAAVLVFQLFPHRPLLGVLVALILSSIVGLFLFSRPDLHMTIFHVILGKTIINDIPAIDQMMNFLNSFGNAAIFSLLFAICATLLPASKELKQHSKRMRYLHIILYTGTLLLIVAMLVKKSIYQWSLAYTVPDGEIADIAKNFVSSLLTIEGGFYTLVLAAAYLPAALVLQRRASLLINSSDEAEKDKELKEFGLNFSITESLPRIIAILGPLFVGPVGELFSTISTKL